MTRPARPAAPGPAYREPTRVSWSVDKPVVLAAFTSQEPPTITTVQRRGGTRAGGRQVIVPVQFGWTSYSLVRPSESGFVPVSPRAGRSRRRLEPGGRRRMLADSTYWEGSASYSPDGRHVAFESMRKGDRQEVWLANADGGEPVQLTRGPGRLQGSPAWLVEGFR